jgi:hypothetical protein
MARTEAGEARLPGWAVGLLMLGTALVSGAMAWSLAGA